jgi:Polymerase beta, Nucleotidyltransferase
MEFKQPKSPKEYAANRNQLLEQIVQFLQEDERFAAAWLTGSFGRNDADDMSDLDITVIVNNAFEKTLCARSHQVGAGTTKERYALFSQFGEPDVIHENNHNAPTDGTFTFVLYKETALVVDWTLRPNINIKRPASAALLFDKSNFPVEPPVSVESLDQRIEMASEKVAFFWLMATVTVKYLVRGDDVSFHRFLDVLNGILWDVRRLVAGEPDQWLKGSLVRMAITREAQILSVRQACQEMMDLMTDVKKMGGVVPLSPISTIETLLQFAEKSIDDSVN